MFRQPPVSLLSFLFELVDFTLQFRQRFRQRFHQPLNRFVAFSQVALRLGLESGEGLLGERDKALRLAL